MLLPLLVHYSSCYSWIEIDPEPIQTASQQVIFKVHKAKAATDILPDPQPDNIDQSNIDWTRQTNSPPFAHLPISAWLCTTCRVFSNLCLPRTSRQKLVEAFAEMETEDVVLVVLQAHLRIVAVVVVDSAVFLSADVDVACVANNRGHLQIDFAAFRCWETMDLQIARFDLPWCQGCVCYNCDNVAVPPKIETLCIALSATVV